ncbi:MAG: family 20 glycosylhydrolase [Clostridia bacterium]|nr:family 20 glycosylhydrolase [Clostridia bacterium]
MSKFNMCFYRSFRCEKLMIGAETSVDGSEICRRILKNAFAKYSGGGNILFHKLMPDEIISRIDTEFPGAYSENPEGYAVIVSAGRADVYSMTERGLLYGAYALIRESENGEIKSGVIYNYPKMKMRAVKVFLPSRENIPFFKKFAEFCSFYGCNTIMIETGGALEYRRHPEINEGWIEYCDNFREYQGKTIDVQKSFGWHKNSIHFENGGGSWLRREEAADIISYCRELLFDVIPEVPSLSHSDYLLTRHPELAERKEDPLPNTYCPSEQGSYELLFDVLEETIEIFKPETINIGHDEYYSIGLCDKCRGKDAAQLYADDINKIYDFLKSRGIRTMLWGDKLLNAISREGFHYGGSHIEYRTNDGREYTVPATYKAIELIPKDIIILNWYWRIMREFDDVFFENGFSEVMYGNFRPLNIYDCRERLENRICGTCISNWSSLDPVHIQRNGIFAFVAYAANMFWNHDFDENEFEENFLAAAEDIYRYGSMNTYKDGFAEITHTASVTRPHNEFVDGYLMDYDKDYLGEYTVYYTDDSESRHKIYFGLNIGYSDAVIGRKEAYDSDMYNLEPYFYEPSLTCGYVKEGNKLYYRMRIVPENGKKIRNILLTDGADCIEVKEIKF